MIIITLASSAIMQWHFGAHSLRKTVMLAANSKHCFNFAFYQRLCGFAYGALQM